MIGLALACLFFLGIHLFVAGTTLRDAIVARIGEQPYLGLFSLASIGGLVWMCLAWSGAPYAVLYNPLPGAREAALVLVGIAFLFAVVGVTTPSPTAVGAEALLEAEDPARGALGITRHPFLWGVALWAFTHLLTNGDSAAVLFFGTFFVLALAGPISIDRKRARRHGAAWERFEARTSNLPFAAIASGRNRLALGELGAWRVVAAVAAYGAILFGHAWLFGVPALPAG